MSAVWAVAKNTLLMTMRRRAALGLLLFVALGVPLVSLFAQGDNTVTGLLKLVTNYNFSLMGGILMLTMLYLSATVLDGEFKGKQIFLLDVKPVPRWQVLLGKWVGLALLSAWLLLIMTSFTYIALMTLTAVSKSVGWWLLLAAMSGPLLAISGFAIFGELRGRGGRLAGWTGAAALLLWTAAALAAGFYGVRLVRNLPGPGRSTELVHDAYREFLVSRASYRPALPDIEAEIDDYAKWLQAQSPEARARLEDPEQFRARLRKELLQRLWPIGYLAGREFVFKDLPAVPGGIGQISVRYKFHGRRGDNSGGWLTHEWVMYNPTTGIATTIFEEKSKTGKTSEITVPPLLLQHGGELRVAVRNTSEPEGDQPEALINVPLTDGMELLLPAGTFEANLARGAVLLWIRLLMICAIGIAANTFLSGPVAAFLLVGVIVTGEANSFVLGMVAPEPTQETNVFLAATSRAAATLLAAAPNFDQTDPAPDLVVGRRIPPARLLIQALLDVGLRGGLFVVIGMICYYRREVGLPTVT